MLTAGQVKYQEEGGRKAMGDPQQDLRLTMPPFAKLGANERQSRPRKLSRTVRADLHGQISHCRHVLNPSSM